MTRNRLVVPQLTALLAVALVLGPARSQDTGAKVDDSKRMVELLDKIEKRLGNMELRSDATMELITKDLKQLRDEVNRLQREVADLRRAPGATSTSNYPQTTPTIPSTSFSITPPAGPAAPAHVRLVNSYLTDMTAYVNGVMYTVLPGQTAVVAVPPGSLNYHVLQAPYPPQARTVAANETLTLTLR
jgi:hypothetical protein